jgi:mRNA interferase RelE/StbE
MPGYTITFARSARKELQRLPNEIAERVLEKIETLTFNARPEGSKKISGAEDLWRLRVGDYRVVYKIDDKSRMVDNAVIRHRREVYR